MVLDRVHRARERAGDAITKMVAGPSLAEEVLKRSGGAWAVVLVPTTWEAPAPSSRDTPEADVLTI
jgi:hypothetical protein